MATAVKKSFNLNTEPKLVEIGNIEVRFRPEVPTRDILPQMAKVQELRKQHENGEEIDVDTVNALTDASRDLIRQHIVEDDRPLFDEIDDMPDRLIGEMVMWIMEDYHKRPTGPSTD